VQEKFTHFPNEVRTHLTHLVWLATGFAILQ